MLARLTILAILALSTTALFHSDKTKVFCSLITTKDECNKVPACTYVALDLAKLYKTQTAFNICLDKRFMLDSLKAATNPANYTSTPDSALATAAGVDPKVDFTSAAGIESVVKGLIAKQAVKYITSYTAVA